MQGVAASTEAVAMGSQATAIGMEASAVGAGVFGTTLTVATGGLLLLVGAIVALAAVLIKKMVDVRDEQIEITRQQGLSAKGAAEYQEQISHAALSASKLGANLSNSKEEMIELQTHMNDALQTNLTLSEKNLQAGAYMMKNMSMTAEEAFEFQEATALTGNDMNTNILVAQNTVDAINDATNMGLRQKDVFKAIGKASATVLANYKNSIGALTKAVAITKQYGMSLDDAAKTSNSLLQIDSSIQDEMEARVLTGKNINLNQARYLALTGDVAGALDETLKQVGSYEEIEKMLPFQRDALAKSIGMSGDELLKASKHQAVLGSLTDKQIKSVDALTDAQIQAGEAEAAGLDEKQKAQILAERSQMKASELTSNAMGKLSVFIDTIAEKGLKGLMFGGGLSDNMKSAGLKTGAQIDEERQTTAKDSATEMHDGVIGPGGKMVVSSPAGAISLNPNDSIVAGTNLFGGGTQTNTATDNTDLISIIKEQNALLKQLVAATSGPTVIKIGNKTIEELDSQISLRKNYNIGPDRTYGNRL
jgi:hypothetical protein